MTGLLVAAALLAGQEAGSLLDLPVLRRGESAFETTSWDRSGGNDDGFTAANASLYTDPLLGPVVFDAGGPGVLVRICIPFWGAGFPAAAALDDYRLRFHFDDEPAPRWDLPMRDLFRKVQPPFDGPFVADHPENPGAGIAYVWIPFERRLRISASPNAYFHEFGWRRGIFPALMPGVSPVPATDEREALLDLAAGGRGTFETLPGPATIVALEVEPTLRDAATLQQLRLRIAFDGATSPQVDAPLGLLFGSGQGECAIDTVAMKMTVGGAYRLLLPMPFSSSARLSIENGSAAALQVRVKLGWIGGVPQGTWGHLQAACRESLPTVAGRDHPILEMDGWGRYVGVVLGVEVNVDVPQDAPFWPADTPAKMNLLLPFLLSHLEGDPRFDVDGARAYSGTGTETFFNWGWYDMPFDLPFSAPFHAYSGKTLSGPPLGLQRSFVRLNLLDPLPFDRSIRAGLEHGPTNSVNGIYRSVAFAYLFAGGSTGEECGLGASSSSNWPLLLVILVLLVKISDP